jgi:hypothetical protein
MDVQFGQDAIIPIQAWDYLTGQPVTSGSAGAFSWSLYGPGSIVAVTTGAAQGQARGEGWYTIQVARAFITTPGLYTLEYSISAPATAVVTNKRVQFRVGTVQAGAMRMRDVLVSLVRGIGGVVRPSTSILNFVVTDPYWGGDSFGSMDGSEIVLIDPVAFTNYADWFRARVVSTNVTSGAMTLNINTGIAVDDTSGRMYAICAPRGQGFMFERLLDELRMAYDEIGMTALASDSVTLDSMDNQLEYRIPDDFLSVASVAVSYHGASPGDLWDDISGSWEVLPDRRLLRVDEGLGLGATNNIRITGAIRCEMPALGAGWTDMRGGYLRDKAKIRLLASSPRVEHQREANLLFANLAQLPSPFRRPEANEVWL